MLLTHVSCDEFTKSACKTRHATPLMQILSCMKPSLMKRYLLTTLILFAFSFCSKHQTNDKATVAGAELAGRWMLIESYLSIGGPGEWIAADVLHPSFVQFGLLNTMVFSSPTGDTTYHYNIID